MAPVAFGWLRASLQLSETGSSSRYFDKLGLGFKVRRHSRRDLVK